METIFSLLSVKVLVIHNNSYNIFLDIITNNKLWDNVFQRVEFTFVYIRNEIIHWYGKEACSK